MSTPSDQKDSIAGALSPSEVKAVAGILSEGGFGNRVESMPDDPIVSEASVRQFTRNIVIADISSDDKKATLMKLGSVNPSVLGSVVFDEIQQMSVKAVANDVDVIRKKELEISVDKSLSASDRAAVNTALQEAHRELNAVVKDDTDAIARAPIPLDAKTRKINRLAGINSSIGTLVQDEIRKIMPQLGSVVDADHGRLVSPDTSGVKPRRGQSL